MALIRCNKASAPISATTDLIALVRTDNYTRFYKWDNGTASNSSGGTTNDSITCFNVKMTYTGSSVYTIENIGNSDITITLQDSSGTSEITLEPSTPVSKTYATATHQLIVLRPKI